MKDIQQLIKKNSQEGRYESIFPKTFTDAVIDRENGAKLTDILAMFNMLFLSYVGSKSLTRLEVPISLRKTGIWVTYVLYDKTVVTEWYAGEAIDDTSFSNDSNWRDGSNSLVGDISISSDGYWVINGEVTTIEAQGEQGITPILRVGPNNHLQVSYTNGSTYVDVSPNPVFTQFRVSNNKLEQSVDLGLTWTVASDYIAAWFKFTGTTGSSQANNVGKIQISRDKGNTWTDLSGEFTNSLHIKGYVATAPNLPSTAVQGDIYGVGPTYDSSDTEQTNPIYQLYVKDSTGWINNGRFTSISAGVVQELGNSETVVMSQKAVTDNIEVSNKNTGISEYEKFSESKSYNTGDIVQYIDNLLYEFTIQHPAGAWIGTDTKRISLKESLSKLENIKASNTLFNKSLEFNRTKFGTEVTNTYLNSKIDINGDIISDNIVTTSVYQVNKGDLFYITPGVWSKSRGDRILYAFYSSSDISNETLLYISDKNITQDISIVVPNDCYLALTFQDGGGGNKTYYKRDYDNAIIDISNVSGKTFNTLLDIRDYIINSLKTCKRYGLKFQYKDNNNIYNYYQFLPSEINNNHYWINDGAFLNSCYKIEENSYTYTDDFIINKYVKEIYISGEGIDLSSNYRITIIQRGIYDDYERKALYLKKEGEEGYGTFFYMDDYSEGRKEYLLDKTIGNIRVIAIIDFSSFTGNKSSYPSTGILNKKAFNIIYSPSINNYLNNTSIYNKIDEVEESIKSTTDVIAKKVDITTYNDGELYKVVKELYIEGSDINPSETYYLQFFRRFDRENGDKYFTLYLNNSAGNIFIYEHVINNFEDLNEDNRNYYIKDLNILILRNKNKYENSTLNLYVIFDYDVMESGVNYGSASIPLNQNTFDLKSSPIIESYLSKIEIENNLSYKVFTTDSETNKYLKELYIYGPGVNPNKKYRITGITWIDRDNFPVMFRIYDEDGNWVVGTEGGETIEDVYSTQGSNYKESGVYVKYIIDWDALGRGNSISYIRENKKINAWITKNAFNINNSPLIRAYDEAQKGGNPLLLAQLSEFNGDINKAIIQVEQTKELPDHVDEDDNDNLLSVEDSEGRNIIEVKNDGSVNIPNGFNSLRLKDSDGNLYEITVDNSTNSLKLTRI